MSIVLSYVYCIKCIQCFTYTTYVSKSYIKIYDLLTYVVYVRLTHIIRITYLLTCLLTHGLTH